MGRLQTPSPEVSGGARSLEHYHAYPGGSAFRGFPRCASSRQLSSKTKAGLGRGDWAKADDLKLGVLVNKYNGVNWDQV